MIGRELDGDHDDGEFLSGGGHAAKFHGQAVLEGAKVRHALQQFDAGLPAGLGHLPAAFGHVASQAADGGMAIPEVNGQQDAQSTKAPKGGAHGAIARRLMRKDHGVHEHGHPHGEHDDRDGNEDAQLYLVMLEVIGLDSVGELHERTLSREVMDAFSNL